MGLRSLRKTLMFNMKTQMKTALILIDIQNDYFPNGKMEVVGSKQASINAKKILEKFRKEKSLVIHIQHLSIREGAGFFIPNSFGAEIHDIVKPLENEKVIIKHFPNSFYQTELYQYLKDNNIEHLVILGMMTHMCVDTTVRSAKDLGFTIEIVGDACATRDQEINGNIVKANDVQNSFLAALNYYFSVVSTTEQYLKN